MQVDLLYPDPAREAELNKFKRLIQCPNAKMIAVQCACGEITNTYSHATNVVKCNKCNKDLLVPSSGKAQKTKNASKIRELAE
ncbi:Ribosomal_protein S27 [Hexamita inflata]|uniref:Ribosomal protein S27 n=1 Tax=Hexamita inflata TaxID=28002 RepID=A0AA86Q028_9EUKA|nr:Ribosomal protein S27 [Hexamita inflata]CAI9947088.1 Ribosomal protein S27 [Hexamita inflata]